MKFSIIIPVLNEAANIQATLSALRNFSDQTEIIVVDGGSKDNTVKQAKMYTDNVLSSAQGRAKQMNAGAKQATGEVLIFLHADTQLPTNALLCIEQAMTTASWGRFDIELMGSSVMFKIIAQCMNWRSRLTGIATGDHVLFISRQLFNAIGGYSDIALMEDIALSKRLKKITKPICLNAKVKTSTRRWQHYGIYKTILLMWSLRLRYWLGANPDYLAELYQTGRLWQQKP